MLQAFFVLSFYFFGNKNPIFAVKKVIWGWKKFKKILIA